MCRQALVLGEGMQLNTFDVAFKSAWAKFNDDGVGVYWRDNPSVVKGEEKHLARFVKSEDLAKIGSTYDRLLIHFRKATQGDGTHPFTCKHKPENNSADWLLVHNGMVHDDKARKEIVKTHKFSTKIDSESLIHLWAEIDHANLKPKERIKAFDKRMKELNITGWANLIFYNVVTDEWFGFCDGSLDIVSIKDLTVVCSDTDWLDSIEAKKLNVKKESMSGGDVAYGTGAKYEIFLKIWKLPNPTAAATGTTQTTFYNGSVGETYGRYGRILRRNESIYDRIQDRSEKTLVEEDLESHFYEPDSNVKDGLGVPLCGVCFCERQLHVLAHTDVEDKKWAKPHAFMKDTDAKTIQCLCGSDTSYGYTHLNHRFDSIKNGSYCANCGNTREIGNHKEVDPSNHYFKPLWVFQEIASQESWRESSFCIRCGHTETIHTMRQTLFKEGGKDSLPKKFKPTNSCLCNPKELKVCQFHWDAGYKMANPETGEIVFGKTSDEAEEDCDDIGGD